VNAWLRANPLRGVLVVMIVFLGVLWIVSRLVSWGSCSWYGYQTERDTRYAAFIGCMVEVDGKWYPRNELRVLQ
jgi:hypothetical protein